MKDCECDSLPHLASLRLAAGPPGVGALPMWSLLCSSSSGCVPLMSQPRMHHFSASLSFILELKEDHTARHTQKHLATCKRGANTCSLQDFKTQPQIL